jgi:hypothetical protein
VLFGRYYCDDKINEEMKRGSDNYGAEEKSFQGFGVET